MDARDYDELLQARDAEIERLREHAVVLAETVRQVERERCAVICEDAKAAIWHYYEPDVKNTASTVCENLAEKIRQIKA